MRAAPAHCIKERSSPSIIWARTTAKGSSTVLTMEALEAPMRLMPAYIRRGGRKLAATATINTYVKTWGSCTKKASSTGF
ncbi:MAG: hypothetical protein XD50_1569 [Clostridia bacterium 41_269]|nr:MAG: hypothetical protein XD50_1569 [Clostridia bacterium 41_269]